MREVVKSKPYRGQYRLTLNTDETLTVPTDVVFQYSIFEGHTFDDSTWQQILVEAERIACYEKLLALLSYRPLTETEARRRLKQRKFSESALNDAVKRGLEARLLDDQMFANMYVDEKLRLSDKGRRAITAELRRRGVTAEQIKSAFAAAYEQLDEREDDVEYQRALTAGEKKWRSLQREPEPQKRREKLLRHLAGRGFAASVCYQVLDAVRSESFD